MTTLFDHFARLRRPRRRPDGGQALVEFSLAVIPFLLLLMGIIDLGRAIYQLNGTAQAAREIAREASVSGVSSNNVDIVIATQRGMVPYFQFTEASDITCVEIDDTVNTRCDPGDYVQVRVRSTFTPATPIVMLFGSHTLESRSEVEIER